MKVMHLAVCRTEFMKFREAVGDPLQFSRCLWHVPLWRYSPSSLKVIEKATFRCM